MLATDIIRKKRDGHPLAPAEIAAFVSGEWPDYQVAALLMAIVLRGMNEAETVELTRAMVRSGVALDLSDLPGPKVDKHSTGGVGDSTSLILAPLAAACGAVVPMMSGRGLGHTGGTLDKLEAIPGFRTALSLDEFRITLRTVGCAMIGPTAEVAPADKRLYALRDVTATVENVSLITASILSKKIAEGIEALVMDVKCGRGAFMKREEDARELARSLVTTGNRQGVRTRALLTRMDTPLGRCVGNALEVRECIAALRGDEPSDLLELSVRLASQMLLLGRLATTLQEADDMIRAALTSGRGLEKLRAIIAGQGGDPRVVDDPARLPTAPHRHLFRAARGGFVTDIHAEHLGRASMRLGAGRTRVEDVVDPAVGIVVCAPVGAEVRPGDPLAEVHYRSDTGLPAALDLLREAWTMGDQPPPATPLLLDTIDGS